MMIKQAYLSLLFLGLLAYHPLDRASAIAPNSLCTAATPRESESLPAVQQQTVRLSNQTTSVGAQQAGWNPSENFDEKCMIMLAYDPNDTFVNLRSQPGGNIITSLPNYTVLRERSGPVVIGNGWNFVDVLESDRSAYIQSGYVWHELIRRTYYQVADPQDTYANLRQLPDGPVLDTLPNGTEVRFIGEQGTWTQVELANGQIGYVATALLAEPNCF